jgi:hypothetical protein
MHSTETALLKTLDHIYTAADHSQPTALVSLDLSAAFDTIDHHTLLSRLHSSYGISGCAYNWIHSYLDGRSQSVVVGRHQSSPTTVSTGVPQGSVLGPLLFSIYISPAGHLINSFGISHQQYADDTQLFISLSRDTFTSGIDQLELCLIALHDWLCINGLSLNPHKSNAICFSSSQSSRHFPSLPSINVAGTSVQLDDTITMLGVTLDNHLTFNQHVASICKSCFYHIRSLRHIRNSLTDEMAKSVALALVSSRLDYANSLLYHTSPANIIKLQRVQNTLAKIVSKRNLTDTKEILRTLHWLPIKWRIDFKIATLTYKIKQSGAPSYLTSAINSYAPSRVLRSAELDLLVTPRCRTVLGSKSFSVAAPTIWNSIPLSIRQAPSITSFKRHLKTHLFSLAIAD